MTTEQPSRIELGKRFLINMVVAPALFVVAAVGIIWLLDAAGII